MLVIHNKLAIFFADKFALPWIVLFYYCTVYVDV